MNDTLDDFEIYSFIDIIYHLKFIKLISLKLILSNNNINMNDMQIFKVFI
jgi:hypothetical protein